MENTLFYAGQFGLILSAIFGLAIIHYKAESPERPAWYYYLTVWGVSFGSALLMSQQANVGSTNWLSQWCYGFELMFGLERLAVWWNYQYGEKSRQLSTRFIVSTNKLLAVLLGSIIVLTFGWAIYHRVEQNGQETHQLRTEVRRNQATAFGDTAKINLMQRKVDTLTTQLVATKAENIRLVRLVTEGNEKLSALTDILISLKRAITRLGLNVERSRTSNISIPVTPMRPKGATGSFILPNIQTPASTPTLRKGGRRDG